MSTLNANIPTFDCWLRKEFLYDLEAHHGEHERVTVFGITSLQGRALGFWVLVHSTGAVVGRLPVSALCWRKARSIWVIGQDGTEDEVREQVDLERAARDRPLDHLQLWDCFSYEVSVIEFEHLSGRRCQALLKDGARVGGRAMFTVDWYGSSYAENAGPSGWKCAHMLELDDGNYALLPNNRILWADPAVIDAPFDRMPDYKIMTHEWSVEHETRWTTGDGMYYEVEHEADHAEG